MNHVGPFHLRRPLLPNPWSLSGKVRTFGKQAGVEKVQARGKKKKEKKVKESNQGLSLLGGARQNQGLTVTEEGCFVFLNDEELT